jgi:hypothetical protein
LLHKVTLKYTQVNEESKPNKPFNCRRSLQKKPLSLSRLNYLEDVLMTKEEQTAEEQKKKQAYYYGKGEKKAKEVKK